MPESRLLLSPEMVQRAEESLGAHGDMERAIRAAFDGVPLSNYAIGLLLDRSDLVVLVRRSGSPIVCERGEDPEGFEVLGHRARLTFDRRGRTNGLTISGIERGEAVTADA